MILEFKPVNLEKKYTDERRLRSEYNKDIEQGMIMFLGFAESTVTAWDLYKMRIFFMEHLKGNLNEYYSVSLDKKKSKWRLIIQMLDDSGNVIVPTDNEKEFLRGVKRIRIGRMSEHYAEY